MIKMVEINDSQFDTIVLKASLPVLVECATSSCIICKTMAERIHEVAKDYVQKVIFLRLDIDANKCWKDYNVRGIPTLLYFKEGRLVARQDSFPETDEIHAQLSSIVGAKSSGNGKRRTGRQKRNSG